MLTHECLCKFAYDEIKNPRFAQYLLSVKMATEGITLVNYPNYLFEKLNYF